MSTGFHLLKVLAAEPETADAVTVTLEPPIGEEGRFTFSAGQHLTFRATIDGEDVRRNYSICSAPDGSALRVAIKRVEGGRFSNWAATALLPGAEIEAMEPRGHFTWPFATEVRHHYMMFAGGSGITPILSLLKTGLALEPHSRFTLLFGNRTSSNIMFLEEIAALKDRYLAQLQIVHVLDSERDEIELFNGRLDEVRISDVLASLIEPALIDVAFICGPDGMMSAAENAMLAAGLARERILVERFATERLSAGERAARSQVRERAQGRTFEVTIDGRSRRIVFDALKGSLLENARAAGLPAPFACKAGVCATCRAKLLAGEVEMSKNYGLSAEEVAQRYILTCQATPVGDGVVLDYDQ